MIPNTDDVNTNSTIVINAMKKALDWSSDPVLDLGNTATTLFEVFEAFFHVALRYRDAYQVIPVLVVDNANKLPRLLLAQFQDYAKEASDSDIATIIFILSKGHILCRLRERSTWSRVQRIFEIGDVSRDEALQYLRLQDLHHVLLNEAKRQLKAAKMLPEGKFHKQEKAIISKLLKENAISDDTYWAIAGGEIEKKML
ncbi:MAG: hypothetical protein M1840_008843 [Geoglossum simile]|nr:MAG: hypothetical protein M1840_008843 [Geoglossum simile]